MARINDNRAGVNSAYEWISEVTKAFNTAFHCEEESYVAGTILGIFEAYGYTDDD